MAVLYNTGARALAEGTLLTETVKLAFLVGDELPDDAQDAQLATLAELLAVTDVDEATGGGYARATVTGIEVEVSSGATVTHAQVSFGSVSCGHVCALVYYLDDDDDTLVSIHEADFTTNGSLVAISGASWIAVNGRALPFEIGTTLTGDGSPSAPLEVTVPKRQVLAVDWDTDDPLSTLDVDVAVITAGTVADSTRTLVVTEPQTDDPWQLVVVNADDYKLTIDTDTASVDGASAVTVAAGAVVQMWFTGTEWFTDIEANLSTLTDAAAARTNLGLAAIYATIAQAKAEVIMVAVGDETTAITTGTAKVTFRMPWAMTLSDVRSSLSEVSSSGNPTVDINESGNSILSTKLSIDVNEKTSTTATTAAVISDASLADDAEITIDVDVAGTGAKGLKVYLIGTRA